jgi:hypothetical protein
MLHCCRVQVRCLVDVPGPKLPADLPGYLRSTVAPQVPPELQEAFLTAVDNEAIRSMQNKQVSCQPMHQPGEPRRGWLGLLLCSVSGRQRQQVLPCIHQQHQQIRLLVSVYVFLR